MTMGRKGNLAVFKSSGISETGVVTPTKIGVHVCYINTYLHEFFEPILFFIVHKQCQPHPNAVNCVDILLMHYMLYV